MDGSVPQPLRILRALLLSVLTFGVGGTVLPDAGAAPPLVRSGIIIVANGAGDFRCCTPAVQKAVAEAGLPLTVETVCWSHGHYRIVADQNDRAHVRAQGQLLAARLIELRRTCPQNAIFLMGHCAGNSVVIAAAEEVPPGTVDRMICLAPSVANDYDLRPALRGCRDGIDAYYSKDDCWLLGLGLHCTSLLWGKYYQAAGRHGFEPVIADSEDALLYSKLRQYPWQSSLACTGHYGGHFGSYQPGFLCAFVCPLLLESLAQLP
jgi:hypothetical protein